MVTCKAAIVTPSGLTYEDGRLLVYCACSYFADFGRCKHLWAAVLEADRRGVLGEAMNGGALRLARDADPDDERELAQWQFRPPEPRRRRKLHPGRSTSPISGTAWKPRSRRRPPGRAISKSSTSWTPAPRRSPARSCSNCFRGRAKRTGSGPSTRNSASRPHRWVRCPTRWTPKPSRPFWAGRNTTSTPTPPPAEWRRARRSRTPWRCA